jgi:hypothetical protein
MIKSILPKVHSFLSSSSMKSDFRATKYGIFSLWQEYLQFPKPGGGIFVPPWFTGVAPCGARWGASGELSEHQP